MEEFPSNSLAPKPAAAEKAEEKHVQKVVTGNVIRKKKPLGKRFREMFLGDDSQGVVEYVFADVLVPALKDMVTDAVSQGMERMIFGETRANNRRSKPSGGGAFGSPNRVAYDRYSSNNQRRDERPSGRKRGHDFDHVILSSRAEAQDVINSLADIIDKYEAVSVKDLYEMVGETYHFTDEKWGWVSMEGAMVRRVSIGYLLDMPKPEPID